MLSKSCHGLWFSGLSLGEIQGFEREPHAVVKMHNFYNFRRNLSKKHIEKSWFWMMIHQANLQELQF